MEAMCTAYAKSGTRSQHFSNCTWGKRSQKARVCCEWKAQIVCEEHFISVNRFMNPVVKVLFKCVIRFSISFRWCAFPNFCTQFLVHFRTVYASPQKSARPEIKKTLISRQVYWPKAQPWTNVFLMLQLAALRKEQSATVRAEESEDIKHIKKVRNNFHKTGHTKSQPSWHF